MSEDKNNEGIAAYMGVSAPETPKYLLTNNFLLEYFKPPKGTARIYEFEKFVNDDVLYTEDAENEQLLQKSFNRFLERYLGEEIIREGNHRLSKNKHYYFPLVKEMLTGSTNTLRHLLYHLQVLDKEFDYKDMQTKLENYIFNDSSGINYLLKILLKSSNENIRCPRRMSEAETKDFWNMLSPAENSRMEKLGARLNADLNILLTHEYFHKLDFYRRYNYLSVLLTSYVIQYIVCRKGANASMLCKGNPQDERLSMMFHRACCNNYNDIRSLFPELLRKYYNNIIKRRIGRDKDELKLEVKDDSVWIEGVPFSEFVANLSAGHKAMTALGCRQIVDAFALHDEGEKSILIDEFVLRYIDMTGTRKGSTLIKISSVLPTSGRQIEMVFPNTNARNKFFAMSTGLAEFYVRLYLAGKDQKYDYLDNFIEHLQNRYRILLVKSEDGDKMLKNIRPKLSAKDFSKNKEAFRDTLNNANCLIKLSDSGYVIALPEEKGDLRLV